MESSVTSERVLSPSDEPSALVQLMSADGAEAEHLRSVVEAVSDLQQVLIDPRTPRQEDTISAWRSGGNFWRLFDSSHQDRTEQLMASTESFLSEALPGLVSQLATGELRSEGIIASLPDDLRRTLSSAYGLDEKFRLGYHARKLAQGRAYYSLARLGERAIPELELEQAKVLSGSFGREELLAEASDRAEDVTTEYADEHFGARLKALEGDFSQAAQDERRHIEQHLGLVYEEALRAEATILASGEIDHSHLGDDQRRILHEIQSVDGIYSYRTGDISEDIRHSVDHAAKNVGLLLAGGFLGRAATMPLKATVGDFAGAQTIKAGWALAARTGSARAAERISRLSVGAGRGVAELAHVPGYVAADEVLQTMLNGREPRSREELVQAMGYATIASAMTGVVGTLGGEALETLSPRAVEAYRTLKSSLGANHPAVIAAETVSQSGAMVGGLVLTNIISRGEVPSDAQEAYDLLVDSTAQVLGPNGSRLATGVAARALQTNLINPRESFRVGAPGRGVTVQTGRSPEGTTPLNPLRIPPAANDNGYPASEPMVVNGSGIVGAVKADGRSATHAAEDLDAIADGLSFPSVKSISDGLVRMQNGNKPYNPSDPSQGDDSTQRAEPGVAQSQETSLSFELGSNLSQGHINLEVAEFLGIKDDINLTELIHVGGEVLGEVSVIGNQLEKGKISYSQAVKQIELISDEYTSTEQPDPEIVELTKSLTVALRSLDEEGGTTLLKELATEVRGAIAQYVQDEATFTSFVDNILFISSVFSEGSNASLYSLRDFTLGPEVRQRVARMYGLPSDEELLVKVAKAQSYGNSLDEEATMQILAGQILEEYDNVASVPEVYLSREYEFDQDTIRRLRERGTKTDAASVDVLIMEQIDGFSVTDILCRKFIAEHEGAMPSVEMTQRELKLQTLKILGIEIDDNAPFAKLAAEVNNSRKEMFDFLATRGLRVNSRVTEILERTISALHENDFFHNDLHPGNVMIRGDENSFFTEGEDVEVVLIDFGISDDMPASWIRDTDILEQMRRLGG